MKLIKLNLTRNCIKYLISLYGIEEIFIPYYICDSVWQAIREEGCRVKFYHIGSDFMPVENLPKDAYIIYPNYFGMCGENTRKLASLYPNFISDNTQAFYSRPTGLASFYSLRKFFTVTNGAYLYVKQFLDYSFEKDEINFDFVSPQVDFDTFAQNERILDNEKDIKYMSDKVEKDMMNIDFEADKLVRLEIYNKYFKKYDKYNKIHFKPDINNIPYCYPFSPKSEQIKRETVSKGVPLIRLWKDMPKEFIEYDFLSDVAALPLNSYCINFI